MTALISPGQLIKKLQTLWGIVYAAGTWSADAKYMEAGTYDNQDPDTSRKHRCAFLGTLLKRPISSAKDLTRAEAETAIRELVKMVPMQFNKRKKRLPRDRARELGTAGRKGFVQKTEQIAGAEELRHIADLRARLGWDESKFNAFMHSRYAPCRQIRTLADANKVRWALKRILKRQEKGPA